MAYIGNKPANKAIVASDLDPAVITGQTALATSPADTDEFLISDAGTLKRIDASLVGGGGITVADQWRLTANFTSNADITSNLERIDTSPQGVLGSMSESSGIFTFPSTGYYWVLFSVNGQSDNGGGTVGGHIKATANNSSYSTVATGQYGASDGRAQSFTISSLIDVTDTSNVKVKFTASSVSNSDELYGSSTENLTCMTFIRIGDT